MAKSTIQKEINVTLTLTEDEAIWLKGIMQNPIHSDIDDESDRDRDNRSALWEALSVVD